MQRFMRHRKLMAFVLAICMVVPLISNQYLIVRAEEPNNIVDTTQQEGEDDSGDKTDIDEVVYMSESVTPITEADITELSLDNQVDLSTLEKQNVSYTRSENNMECTDTHYWLKVNVPEGSTYIITNLYTLETFCSTTVYRYDEEKGALYGDGGYGYISLKEAGDIYTLTSGLYYINFYSETPVQTTLSLKEQAPAIKIVELKESAYEVTAEDIENGTVTLTKQEGNYTYPDYNGEYTFTSIYGNLVKITVPANMEYGLSTVGGIFYVYNADMDKLLKLSMMDNTCSIENNTDCDTVYYVWFKMNDSEATPQFKIQVPQKLIDIKDSAYEVTADDIGKGTINLTRQDGYYTYPDSNGEYTHTSSYGNLIKITVPVNTAYVLGTGQGNFTIYDDSMDKEILSGYDCITNETDTAKVYYVWLKMYMYESAPEFEIKTAQKIADMKDSAYELTAEDVKMGTVNLTVQEGRYTYPDSDGKYTYSSKSGRLIKITVPANTIYDLSSPNNLFSVSFATYGEDIEKLLSTECIINNTDSESVYYVWVNDTANYSSDYGSREIQFEINETDRLNSLKDKAYVVTAEDINKGTITIDTLEGYYSLPDSDGEYVCTSSNGNLIKITVPAHKAYKFESLNFTVFDVNIEKEIVPKSGFSQDIINNTDSDAIYYVWVQNSFSGRTVDFEISELQKLIDIKDSAYEVTIEDINNGVLNLTEQYGSYIHPDSNGEYTNTSAYGNLVKIRVPANTVYRLSTTNGRFYVYNTDISKALANKADNYLLENDTYRETEYYVWLVMNTSTITPQLQIEEVDDFKHLSDLEADAIELVGDEYNANESHLDTVKIPVGVSNEGIVSYDKSSGKLYKLALTAKNTVTITDSNETDKLYIYGDGDLDEVPIVCGDGSVVFSNLANEQKTYYLWVAGDNDGVTITKEVTALDKKEDKTESGTKIDTTVDTTDKGASIIVSENKDTSDKVEEAVVKVSVADATDSDEAIQKGIDVIMHYNSDNEGKTQVDRIEVSYSGDESVIVSESTINSLKNLQGNVSLEVSKKSGEDEDKTVYTWRFKPESIETVEAVNTQIDIYENAIGYENKTVVDNLTDKAATKCVLAFEHNGVLPENTEVSVGVADQYTDGTELYYYHIDIENNKLEEIGTTVVENGCVTLKLSHCSDYVMSDKPVCQHSNTEIRGQKSASCTAEGYTGDTYCKDCGIQLSTGTSIPKTAHVAGQWIIDKEATVDAEGSMHTECTVCKTVLDTKNIDKLPAPKPEPTPAPTTDAMVTASGVYVASHTKDTIVVGLVATPSKTADLEYRWLVCDTSVDSNKWTEIQGWTKNNERLTWKPGKTGDYVIVGQVRVVGNEESQSQASVGIPHHAQIKGKCQMPYTGEGGGYLIGIESYDNPNQEYTYELLVLDCTLLAEGKDAWVWSTGRCKVPETSFWAVWQPQYGYYWTLFRVYDKDGNLIDQECYSFVNAY